MTYNKEQLIEYLRTECAKPIKEQHKWLNAIYFYPDAALFIYNDHSLTSKDVFDLVLEKKIDYVGLRKHQGQMMPCYQLS